MKREPSVFSRVRDLTPGEEVFLPSEKAYAASCAVAYMEAEYEYSYTVTNSTDGVVSVKRDA